MNVGKDVSGLDAAQQGTPTTAEVNWAKFATAHQQQAGWIADEAPRFDFAAAMLETARRYGRLTDRQSAAVDRCRTREAAPRSFDEVGIDTRGRSSGEFKALCPRCSKLRRKSTDRCLSVNASSGVWNCWHCGWAGGLRSDRPATMPRPSSAIATTTPRAAPDPGDERKVADALLEWGRGLPIRGTDAARYLIRRGGCLPPADGHIRFIADLQRFRFDGPAMIALITNAIDARRAIGLHITWLLPDGAGRRERRILGHTKDADGTPGIIRLWADDRVTMGLGVAEGIETALCAAHAFAPMWALMSADNMRDFPALPGIEAITIFADNDSDRSDRKGQRAAAECAARWRRAGAGIRVVIADNEGEDVADEVVRCAA